ncbi:MAG: hypothetical protein EXR80_06350 [Methylococcales bacterium]|nr:hypothetical protein [Methylococcales bacterium]
MHPKDWLNYYLAHQDRQSLRDRGQPLYRYGMNDDEYKTLQTALKDDVTNITKNSGWNAGNVNMMAAHGNGIKFLLPLVQVIRN